MQRLYTELNLGDLGIFVDDTGAAMRLLNVFALPATLLIDPDGNEIARKTGAAEWNSAEAVAYFRARLAE